VDVGYFLTGNAMCLIGEPLAPRSFSEAAMKANSYTPPQHYSPLRLDEPLHCFKLDARMIVQILPGVAVMPGLPRPDQHRVPFSSATFCLLNAPWRSAARAWRGRLK
jgi:hypothetical protein